MMSLSFIFLFIVIPTQAGIYLANVFYCAKYKWIPAYAGMTIIFIFPLKLLAADLYPFNNTTDAERFKTLTTELRCLVCQNQNISESNAPLASDLRQQIYLQIKQGQSNQNILTYLKDRYGNFILYRPPLNKSTIILWLGPFILLMIVISFLIRYLRHTLKDS